MQLFTLQCVCVCVCAVYICIRKRKRRDDFRHSWSLNKHNSEHKTAITMHGTLSRVSHNVSYHIQSHIPNYPILPVSHYTIRYPISLAFYETVSFVYQILEYRLLTLYFVKYFILPVSQYTIHYPTCLTFYNTASSVSHILRRITYTTCPLC